MVGHPNALPEIIVQVTLSYIDPSKLLGQVCSVNTTRPIPIVSVLAPQSS